MVRLGLLIIGGNVTMPQESEAARTLRAAREELRRTGAKPMSGTKKVLLGVGVAIWAVAVGTAVTLNVADARKPKAVPSAPASPVALAATPDVTPSVEVASPKAPSLSASDAFPICKEAVLDQITHPSTADFSIFGVGFKSYEDGTAILGTTFTARNGFNLELEYEAVCDFTGTTLIGVKIREAR